ncbi:MAG: SH3 domain-containing protein [Saprospiraceae bacterium]
MKTHILMLIMVLSSVFATAQMEETLVDLDRNVVIATSGLNMRNAPSLTANIVGYVPFAANLEIVDDLAYGKDTLSSAYTIHYETGEAYEANLAGYWVKAKYKNLEGYVFSSYLFYDLSEREDSLNEAYILLFEGTDCYDNVRYNKDWYWYGLYEEGNRSVLRAVELSFFAEETELGVFLGIATNLDQASVYLIGSENPLPQRVLKNATHVDYSQQFFDRENVANLELLEAAGLAIVQPKGENEWGFSLIVKDETGARQLLNPEDSDFYYPSGIDWYGDLDGDGKMDYIIHYGEEMSQTVLYLSSKAKPGALVHPVAAYFSGYCC